MMASEDDIRRERARARLAARQGRALPETATDEYASGRMLVPRQGTPISKRSGSSRAITQEDLDAVNARRKAARRQSAQPSEAQASGKLPRISGNAAKGKIPRGSRQGGKPAGKLNSRNSVFSSSGGFRAKPKSRLQAVLPKALMLLVVVALLTGLVLLGRGCVAKVNDFIANYQARNAEPAEPGPVPDFFEVSAIVGDNLAFKLIEKSILLPDAYWIAMNVDQYEQYGATYQRKLIRLAAMDTNAVSFVRNYPESYPAESGQSGLPAWEGEGVPLYYQYDERWGYVKYGGKGFALTGCGPTCLAMVYQHITGQNDMSPYDMGVFASNNGYVTESDGTYTSFFLEGSASLGLYPHDLPISKDSITWALQNNGVIVANMREGDFTEGGHYIVLAGLDGEGKLIVNDPYSSVNSAKTWDIDTVMSQSIRMVAYYKS